MRAPTLSRTLGGVLLCLALALAVQAETVVVDDGAALQWIANGSDPGLGQSWTLSAFDDSGWSPGIYGIGYDDSGLAADLISTLVPNTSVSVYTRTTFDVPDTSAVGNLFLGIDYDDGWALWINGVEVGRSGNLAAGALDWNSIATSHESSNSSAPLYEWFNLTSTALAALTNGTNVVALGVWNTGAGSSDLVLAPTIVLDKLPALTRGPYLQRGDSDSVIVRWRTDAPSATEVLCGTTQGALASCFQDPTLVTDHLAPLTALPADTEQFYAVGTGTTVLAGDDVAHRFRTAPLPGVAKPTRIWIIGDSGTANTDAAAVRDAYTTFGAGTDTDLLLMLGDNAYPNGTDLEYQQAVFDTYPDLLRRTPVWPAFGNHDAISSNAVPMSGPYFEMFSLPTGGESGGVSSGTEVYYSFDYGNIHFVVLDSQTSDRSPGSTMLSWLEADLAATAQDWLIAYWHHPPYSKGSHDSDSETQLIEMRENVLPILEDYGVDLVFTGHSHSYERSFLLDGHHGPSASFHDGMKIDLGDGDESGDGAYQKPIAGPDPHRGTVYTVAGNAGKISGGSLNHPAILVAFNELGSVVLDIDGLRADCRFLNSSGTVRDHFTMTKGPTMLAPIAQIGVDSPAGKAPFTVQLLDRSRNVPDTWAWDFENDGSVDSIIQSPQHTYSTPGIYSVALTVSNTNGADQTVATDLVCVTAGIPGPVENLRFDDNTTFSWDAAGGAGSRYDVLRGDLSLLRNSGLSASQLACPVIDTQGTSAVDTTAATPSQPFYYLVRARNCAAESGTYDTFGPGQAGSRDLALQGSGATCGCSASEDSDADGLCANLDNCPGVASSDLSDDDADGRGNVCDSCPLDADNDADIDGICGDVDNCPLLANPLQLDFDLDLSGDLCDTCTDLDQDGFGDPGFANNLCALDNCPAVQNPNQINADGDAFGNLCDVCPNDPQDDIDGDAICGDTDNCPLLANANQDDADADLIGDVCDPCTDLDGDGAGDPGFGANLCALDNCPAEVNPAQSNLDNDLFGDLCDSCPLDAMNDFDGDGICGDTDNCRFLANAAQINDDGDAFGNACDPCPADPLNDLDGDFICGDIDNCPADANLSQADFDGDLAGDVCDADDDNDGVVDSSDCAPFVRGVSRLPGAIGASLSLDKPSGSIRWLRGEEGHVSNLYRAVRAAQQPYDGLFSCYLPESPAPNSVETQTPPAGLVFYYLASARNICGESAAGMGNGMPTVPAPACVALFSDFDSDSVLDLEDNCPLASNPQQSDGDGDFVGDDCDNCPAVPNPDQADSDGDMLGDACE